MEKSLGHDVFALYNQKILTMKEININQTSKYIDNDSITMAHYTLSIPKIIYIATVSNK